MFEFVLFLLLPVAVASGWWVRHKQELRRQHKSQLKLSTRYIRGLNYLLNEQTDKAIEAFIDVLEVDSETVETHLALGNLFRRRGEVDKAIRLHQNLVARPALSAEEHKAALLELGQDYLAAGVYDRAEKVFLQVNQQNHYSKMANQALLQIYEHSQDWDKAIHIARIISKKSGFDLSCQVSHYYCEQAEHALVDGDFSSATKQVKQATIQFAESARALLLNAKIAMTQQDYKGAKKAYIKLAQLQPHYLSLALTEIEDCFIQLGDEQGFYRFLQAALIDGAGISIANKLFELYQKAGDDRKAAEFLTTFLQQHPSLKGLQSLIKLHIKHANDSSRESLQLLDSIVEQLHNTKPNFRCQSCGFSGKQMHWNCPSCKSWDTYRPIIGIEGE